MARRADHTKEELEALIVSAARQLIVADGVDKLSARRLSKEIGYAPGTLYHHFDDLDAIVTAVNVGTLKGLALAFSQAQEGELSGDTLHRYADVFLDYVQRNKNLWNALFEFRRAPGTEVPEWYVAKIDGLIHMLTACFVAERSDLPEEQAQEASRLLFASVHSVSSLENSGRLQLIMNQNIAEIAHNLVDIHLQAYKNRKN